MKRIHRTDQVGMVAIIVTMIMMLVITLIVLGFSEVTRRNQREALDTQLGTQAYYAAETGVNDVVTSVNHGSTPTSTNCNTFLAKDASGASVTLPRKLKADNSVANTCLIINATPNSLIADSVAPSTGSVQWHVMNLSGNPFTKLTFSWAPDPSAAGTCAASAAYKTYPKATAWNCTNALLRVDIFNRAAVASFDAPTLAAATRTLYLMPVNGAGTGVTLNLTAKAYQGSCNASGAGHICTATVNVGGLASANYFVRVTSMYATAKSVTLRGYEGFAGTIPAKFTDGQIVVDSTGRAQDQVKRIRVRIPLGSVTTAAPVFAVQGTDTICKNSTVLAPSTYDEACNWP